MAHRCPLSTRWPSSVNWARAIIVSRAHFDGARFSEHPAAAQIGILALTLARNAVSRLDGMRGRVAKARHPSHRPTGISLASGLRASRTAFLFGCARRSS
jgi:hypothetical protein